MTVGLFLCVVLLEVALASEQPALQEALELAPPNGSINLNVEIFVRHIDVSSDDSTYKVQMSFRQRWNDPRLVHQQPDLHLDPTKIWTPDLFFRNELSGISHHQLKENSFCRVNRHGDIVYSRRITLVLSCPMDFHYFPYDEQTCIMEIASWGYADNKLNISWRQPRPVTIRANVRWTDFKMTSLQTETGSNLPTNIGNFPSLIARFGLQRNARHFLTAAFLPVSLLVIISMLSFWMTCSPLRITFVTLVLMAAIALCQSVNSALPQTTYCRAIDFFMGFCLTFIVVVLIESVFVQFRFKRNTEKSATFDDIDDNSVDRVSRFILPISFVAFVSLYTFIMLLL